MNKIKFIIKIAIVNFILGVLLCALVAYFSNSFSAEFVSGSVLGIASSMLSIYLFYKSWQGAPNKTAVIIYHILRAAVVFGSVIIALFVSYFNALAVILPHLTTMPIIALFFAFYKGGNGD